MVFRILEGLPVEDVRRFLALAKRRTFERDEVVFHHGDPADAVHLITKGRFARRVLTPVGQSAMLAVRGPGDTFGELVLVWTGMGRLVTVSALEPGETLSIAGVTFRGLLGQHPELKDVLVKLLAERLRNADRAHHREPLPRRRRTRSLGAASARSCLREWRRRGRPAHRRALRSSPARHEAP